MDVNVRVVRCGCAANLGPNGIRASLVGLKGALRRRSHGMTGVVTKSRLLIVEGHCVASSGCRGREAQRKTYFEVSLDVTSGDGGRCGVPPIVRRGSKWYQSTICKDLQNKFVDHER